VDSTSFQMMHDCERLANHVYKLMYGFAITWFNKMQVRGIFVHLMV